MPEIDRPRVHQHHQAESFLGHQRRDCIGAVQTAGVHREQPALVVLQEPAEPVRVKVRLRLSRGRITDAGEQHLRFQHFRDRVRFHERLALERALVEQHAQPLRHVRGARLNASRAERIGRQVRLVSRTTPCSIRCAPVTLARLLSSGPVNRLSLMPSGARMRRADELLEASRPRRAQRPRPRRCT